jgi:hypothetical protein
LLTFFLLKQQKMANTSIVVTGDIPDADPRTAALAPPKPLNATTQRPRPLGAGPFLSVPLRAETEGTTVA